MKPDKRYTINLEFCGHSSKRFVLRFCGKYIDNYPSKTAAELGKRLHNEVRLHNIFKEVY